MPDGDRLRAGALAAAIAQAGPALTRVAHMLASYRDELIAAGFPHDEALELCLDLQRDIIIGPVEEVR